MSKLWKARQKEIEAATRNRRELIAAKLSRRELMKMGLITSAGLLVPKRDFKRSMAQPARGHPR